MDQPAQSRGVAAATYNCALRIRSFGTVGIMIKGAGSANSLFCQ